MPKFCGYCGKPIKEGSKFCSGCGKPIAILLKNKRQEDSSTSLNVIVNKFQNGNKKAFQKIYDSTNQSTYNSIIHLIDNSDLVLKIMKDTYTTTFKRLSDGEKLSDIKLWIINIAQNLCSNYFEKESFEGLISVEKKQGISNDINEILLPEGVMDSEEKQQLLIKIIHNLPQMERLMVACYYYYGMNIEDIAKSYNISEKEIKAHLSKAINQINTNVAKTEMKKSMKPYATAAAPLIAMLFSKEVQANSIPEQVVESIEEVISRLLSGIENLVKSQADSSNQSFPNEDGKNMSDNASRKLETSKQKPIEKKSELDEVEAGSEEDLSEGLEESKDSVEEQPEEIQKEKPEEIQEEQSEEIQEEKPEEIQEEQPEEIQEEQPEEIQEEQPEEIQEEQPEEIQEEQTEKIQEEQPEEIQEDQLEEIQEEQPEEIQEEQPEKIQEEKPEKIQKEQSEEIQQEQSEDTQEDITENDTRDENPGEQNAESDSTSGTEPLKGTETAKTPLSEAEAGMNSAATATEGITTAGTVAADIVTAGTTAVDIATAGMAAGTTATAGMAASGTAATGIGAMIKAAIGTKLMTGIVAASIATTGIVYYNVNHSTPEKTLEKFEDNYNELDIDGMMKCIDPEIQKYYDSGLSAVAEFIGYSKEDILETITEFIVGSEDYLEYEHMKIDITVQSIVPTGENTVDVYIRLDTIENAREYQTESSEDIIPMIKVDDKWYIEFQL